MATKATTEDVIIIGAGPAGLALGHALAKHGIAPLLLEAGDSPGWSWANMPRNITLLSPWKVNHLPGTQTTIADQHALHSCHDFAAYLRDYAAENGLRIFPNCAVKTVRKTQSGYSLKTANGTLRTRLLVNATGYFAKPRWPRFRGMSTSTVRQMHVHDFRSAADTFAELGVARPRVLVVGRRISAGQTIAELHDAKLLDSKLEFDVILSRRGPVTFAPRPWLLKLAFWLFYRWEDAQVDKDPFGLSDTFPPMEGGRERDLLVSGSVRQVPDIARFHADEVEFVDNSRERFDLVIYTTGFWPALDHLGKLVSADAATGLPPMSDMQSTESPDLYFLGLDKQRSFRSRYLRGIREDATLLAHMVAARVDALRAAARSSK